ncbi:MAG: ankyrin repeat domain-containing protein [Deltaproteobacteria bacterium]|nr:ankyrin repeat domain-containing protein [Deltaproteobacteria bacterium]
MRALLSVLLLLSGGNLALGSDHNSSSNPDNPELLAAINAPDTFGRTLLHRAVEKGDASQVAERLRLGADADLSDNFDCTPLHKAVERGFVDIVTLLLEHGADIDSGDFVGLTPLHKAVERGFVDIVTLLLEHGADANLSDDFGWTPLHRAAERGLVPVVSILLKHDGVKIDQPDKRKRTPLQMAIERQSWDVVSLLRQSGAAVHKKPENAPFLETFPYDPYERSKADRSSSGIEQQVVEAANRQDAAAQQVGAKAEEKDKDTVGASCFHRIRSQFLPISAMVGLASLGIWYWQKPVPADEPKEEQDSDIIAGEQVLLPEEDLDILSSDLSSEL